MITPVLLCGGSGTRLWPVSNASRPKQFLRLTGDASMLQSTARRVAGGTYAAPIVVAGADHEDIVREQLAEAGIDLGSLILEPYGRNTAPAIALAALIVNPDTLLLVLPSDHAIGDEAAFSRAVAAGVPHARRNWIVTFGIAPDRPETGFGYIERGEPLGGGAYVVQAFIEKPDAATARSYMEGGAHSWNGGIFLMRAGRLLDELARQAPAILEGAAAALENGRRDGTRVAPDPAAFARVPSISIDYAIMEGAGKTAVVPVDMRWSDVGSWDALHAIGDKDASGNMVVGRAEVIDGANCLVHADGPRVVTVGVSDVIVIATGEAVLVLPRGQSQRAREAAIQNIAKPGK